MFSWLWRMWRLKRGKTGYHTPLEGILRFPFQSAQPEKTTPEIGGQTLEVCLASTATGARRRAVAARHRGPSLASRVNVRAAPRHPRAD